MCSTASATNAAFPPGFVTSARFTSTATLSQVLAMWPRLWARWTTQRTTCRTLSFPTMLCRGQQARRALAFPATFRTRLSDKGTSSSRRDASACAAAEQRLTATHGSLCLTQGAQLFVRNTHPWKLQRSWLCQLRLAILGCGSRGSHCCRCPGCAVAKIIKRIHCIIKHILGCLWLLSILLVWLFY